MTAAALHVVSEVTSAQGILAMWSCHCPSITPWSSREYLESSDLYACKRERVAFMQEAVECFLLYMLAPMHLSK